MSLYRWYIPQYVFIILIFFMYAAIIIKLLVKVSLIIVKLVVPCIVPFPSCVNQIGAQLLFTFHLIQTRSRTWQGTYDPTVQREKEGLREDIKSLLWYPTVYFAVSLLPLINR